jgi:proteasome assembly chaperone (PAC2) family protein
MPANEFSVSVEENLVLFEGKEPNVRWESFGDCLFELAGRVGLERIYAVGSVAGSVPHTRDPRMSCSVSHEHLREGLVESGMRLGQYEGPASIVTYLTQRAPREEMEMVSLVAEIPVYVDGTNPICIESVTRKVAGVLGVQVDLGELRAWRDMFERRLSEVVKDEDELLEQVRRLESDYDNDIFDTEMSELKEWLRNRGIRTD